MADAQRLKSCDQKKSCGFESRHRHQRHCGFQRKFAERGKGSCPPNHLCSELSEKGTLQFLLSQVADQRISSVQGAAVCFSQGAWLVTKGNFNYESVPVGMTGRMPQDACSALSFPDSLCPTPCLIVTRYCHAQFQSAMRTDKMKLQNTDDCLVEPWWVTILGCVTLAILFALALVAT